MRRHFGSCQQSGEANITVSWRRRQQVRVWIQSQQSLEAWGVVLTLLEQPHSFFWAQFSLGCGGAVAGTVGTDRTHGWDGKTAGPAVLSPAQRWTGHVWCIDDVFRSHPAPSHPARRGPWGFSTQDNQGTVLRQSPQTESRERGQKGCNS